MALVKMVGPAVRLVVHNRSCAAVAPQHHLFRTVATFLTEPQLRQALAEGLRFRWAGGKFDKFQTEIVWRCRGVKQRCIAVVQLPVGLLLQPLQRAVAIFRRCAVRRSAEAVIENFQRPRAAIAAAGSDRGQSPPAAAVPALGSSGNGGSTPEHPSSSAAHRPAAER